MRPRPLSPHLQVYRLPGTALLSISHRLTGVILTLGTVLGIGLLGTLAWDEAGFNRWCEAMAVPAGRCALWLWLYAFLFHWCHGVRHLLWDAGRGFDRTRMSRYAGIEVAASIVLWIGVLMVSQLLV